MPCRFCKYWFTATVNPYLQLVEPLANSKCSHATDQQHARSDEKIDHRLKQATSNGSNYSVDSPAPPKLPALLGKYHHPIFPRCTSSQLFAFSTLLLTLASYD
ncbi:hypothetical protein GOP47_0009487 [Adiantum capillus-veneris]|uniref:Uncharacterized protein n=1 Tax=Adiantum capillus-veneris TaxID=13818 RepID=A0A9D4UWW2_ADICA|nr:hypothetical protein GOP47_0009487 [Adiantum capillus-veneris]